MTKRLVEIDDDLLSSARQALGTETIKDTVTVALRETVAAVARREVVESLMAGARNELADPGARDRLWRS